MALKAQKARNELLSVVNKNVQATLYGMQIPSTAAVTISTSVVPSTSALSTTGSDGVIHSAETKLFVYPYFVSLILWTTDSAKYCQISPALSEIEIQSLKSRWKIWLCFILLKKYAVMGEMVRPMPFTLLAGTYSLNRLEYNCS